MLNVLIGNDFWGAGNFGDDLMLEGFVSWRARHDLDWRISILCAHDIAAMRARFPIFNWIAANESSRAEALEWADVWLVIGGSVFQSDVGPWLLDRIAEDLTNAARRSIPAFLVGVGLNNVDALATEQARTIHKLASAIWVRDVRCLEAMLSAGFSHEKVRLGADVAHLAFSGRAKQEQLSGVAACLIDESEVPDCLAIARVLRDHDSSLTWLCQEVRHLTGSELSLYQLIPSGLTANFKLSCLDYRLATLGNMFEEFQRFETLLTSRYHMTMAGAWAGSRVAVYDRNAKLTGIREELGLVECSNLCSEDAIALALKNATMADRATLHSCAARAEQMLDQFAAAANGMSGRR
ncbi:MAG: polysaccharide pyruvyl transferase family protein [Pseudomonadota bacterium]